MQKDQFCNLTCHVARYMQLVGGEWIIFDLLNSYLAPRLGGIKQKKFVLFIAEPQDDFFCFIPSSPEAKYEFYYIRIAIVKLGGSFGAIFLSFSMKVAGGNPRPSVTALCTHSPPPPLTRSHFSIIKMKNKTELTLLLLTHPTNHFP